MRARGGEKEINRGERGERGEEIIIFLLRALRVYFCGFECRAVLGGLRRPRGADATKMFATPREGHIRCAECHNGGLVGFAPPPQNGKEWNDEEAKRAYLALSRLIIPGNPEQSRFMLKPLHPDGGGSYAHNGVRRWQTKSDPEWQMLAGWVRGEKTGPTCS